MAAWSYKPETRTTGDDGTAPLRRVQLEDCIERLAEAGIRNRGELIRICKALTGLPRGEIGFNIDLVFADGRYPPLGITAFVKGT